MHVVDMLRINLVAGNLPASSVMCLFIKAHRGSLARQSKQQQKEK